MQFEHSPGPLIKIKKNFGSLIFVLPALILILIFRYLPILYAAVASLSDYSLLGGFTRFLGLANYAQALKDPLFWNSLLVVAEYLLVKVPLQIVLALWLAILLQKESFTARVLRTIILVPTVLSLIVISLIWALILHSEVGLLNSFLSLFGIAKQTFLTNAGRAMPCIAIMVLWKDLGLSMLILLAGLNNIPESFIEAAKVDGASWGQVFRLIKIPLMTRSFLYILLTETVSSFQVFAPVFATTQGGPFNATRAIVFYIYQNGFQLGQMGYASALSVILLLFTLVLSILIMRISRKEVEY